MDIWDWALETYARPGVAEACLRLQDEHGQNVSYLLWAVWAGSEDRDLLARAADAARAWDDAALHPLRAARRSLKAELPPVDDRGREALRQDVKAAELFAERLLMEALAGITGARAGGLPLAALEAAADAWGRPPPAWMLADLARALG